MGNSEIKRDLCFQEKRWYYHRPLSAINSAPHNIQLSPVTLLMLRCLSSYIRCHFQGSCSPRCLKLQWWSINPGADRNELRQMKERVEEWKFCECMVGCLVMNSSPCFLNFAPVRQLHHYAAPSPCIHLIYWKVWWSRQTLLQTPRQFCAQIQMLTQKGTFAG